MKIRCFDSQMDTLRILLVRVVVNGIRDVISPVGRRDVVVRALVTLQVLLHVYRCLGHRWDGKSVGKEGAELTMYGPQDLYEI